MITMITLQWYDNVTVTKVTLNLKYHIIVIYRVIDININLILIN